MSLSHICKFGKVDVDLDVKSLSIQGVPVVNDSGFFYYEPVEIPAPIPYGVTPVILTNPLNASGTNLWTPEVGDILAFKYESQLSSTVSGNTIDFNLIYDSEALIQSNFNLLTIPNILDPGGGLSFSGSIYCKQKTINGGNYDFTFLCSLSVKSSGTDFLLNYQNEQSFTSPNINGLIEMNLSADSAGQILTTSLIIKKIN